MNLLLDTHILLWFLNDNPALPPKAKSAIEDFQNQSYVSVASLWEIAIKLSLGKLKLPLAFEDIFPSQLEINGIEILPIKNEHFKTLLELPWHHRDPFDRLITAQSIHEKMTIVTVDENFKKYSALLTL